MTQVVERRPPQVKTASDVDEAGLLLERAAEILEQQGWTQRRLIQPDGRVCVLGAISAAAGAPSFVWPSAIDLPAVSWALGRVAGKIEKSYGEALDRAVSEYPDDKRTDEVLIYLWNDDVAEDAQEVARVLREAAAEGAR